MCRSKATCLKCNNFRQMTQHHVYPRRWRWEAHLREVVIELCRECYSELERVIDASEKKRWGRRQLPETMYLALLGSFLATRRTI